jgi:hypothetical protein
MNRDQLGDMAGEAMEAGLESAIELLQSAQPSVAVENQTWDSAIAVLNIFLAKAKAARVGTVVKHYG